jgi:hypothetical protein
MNQLTLALVALALVGCGKLDESGLDSSTDSSTDAGLDAPVGCTYTTYDGSTAFCPLGQHRGCPSRDACNKCGCSEGSTGLVLGCTTLDCPTR